MPKILSDEDSNKTLNKTLLAVIVLVSWLLISCFSSSAQASTTVNIKLPDRQQTNKSPLNEKPGKSTSKKGGSKKPPEGMRKDNILNKYISISNQKKVINLKRTNSKNGLRWRSIMKVGDSNTEGFNNIYGLGCEDIQYGAFNYLWKTTQTYRAISYPESWKIAGDCSLNKSNVFSRNSGAARGGMPTEWLHRPISDLPDSGWGRRDPNCYMTETPLTCEMRMMKPRYAFIMMGTNDFGWLTPETETVKNLKKTIRILLRNGTIPILFTLPALTPEIVNRNGVSAGDWLKRTNQNIKAISIEEGIPLVDLAKALNQTSMVNQGLSELDNIHLSTYPGTGQESPLYNSVNFNDIALKYGVNYRNLLLLQTLYVLNSLNRFQTNWR